MIRLLSFLLLSTGICCSCDDRSGAKRPDESIAENKSTIRSPQKTRHFTGAFSNGMKGDSISFDISADGTALSNLIFKGYWRCNGRLESVTAGPDGNFQIIDHKVKGHISEPPGGGSTAWRFDMEAAIDGNTAQGSFRMNINDLGCDSYKLNWTASEL